MVRWIRYARHGLPSLIFGCVVVHVVLSML